MNTWNYKMFCLHNELSRRAIDSIIRSDGRGWRLLHSAILIESIVPDNVSRMLTRRRLVRMHGLQPDMKRQFIKRLVNDLDSVDEILNELGAEMGLHGRFVGNNEEHLEDVP